MMIFCPIYFKTTILFSALARPYKSKLNRLRIDFLPQREYKEETLLVQLPKDVDASKVKWVSVYCGEFDISFGDVEKGSIGSRCD